MTVSLIIPPAAGCSFFRTQISWVSHWMSYVHDCPGSSKRPKYCIINWHVLGLRDVFYVEDTGSNLTVQEVRFETIAISRPIRGPIVTILNGATAQNSKTLRPTGSSGVEFGAAAGGVGSATGDLRLDYLWKYWCGTFCCSDESSTI
jgi:hypothetical protein